MKISNYACIGFPLFHLRPTVYLGTPPHHQSNDTKVSLLAYPLLSMQTYLLKIQEVKPILKIFFYPIIFINLGDKNVAPVRS